MTLTQAAFVAGAVWAGAAAAAEPVRWTETRSIPAPEAVQAAAADDRFVYAVASAAVAKYDRRTGERVAVSTGKATHLNSAVLLDGRLYLAHSNYPKRPERSEIFVLDPGSMALTPFKDFGEYGGSLTWAVRDGDAWWCNFALYGEANAGTFLVRFDDAWRETGRWTYPPEVVRELGRHSISGGVWRDGELLVTGHDDPVLFRLRLPQAGTVLDYAGREAAPFSGQGIAADPATDGLVGVRRAKREVVFAAPASSRDDAGR